MSDFKVGDKVILARLKEEGKINLEMLQKRNNYIMKGNKNENK